MSRIGKKPVPVPKGVEANVNGQTVSVKGPKGTAEFVVNELCTASLGEDGVTIAPVDKSKAARSMWGMSRTMVANAFEGVSEGFTRRLELVGVGYRAQMKGSDLSLALGHSHDITFTPPQGVSIKVTKPTEIEISGTDKQAVGQTAAKIRGFRPPEPYKGKGVKYEGEYIFRKEGKKK